MANWLFPVVGATEWSGGSWMPKQKTHRGRTHAAIDIYAKTGAPIIASVKGKVAGSGRGDIGGNWIKIQGDDGLLYYYAHMDSHAGLSVGQAVGPGTKIGTVGNTGSASRTKPHVHFSVKRDGVAVNPIQMLKDGVVVPRVDPGLELREKMRSAETRDRQSEAGNFGPPAEPEYGEVVGGWAEQIEAYRREMAAAGAGAQEEPPVKATARQRMQQTMINMSRMVRQQGFDTHAGIPDTGIDEGEGEQDISREAPERDRGERRA